MSLTHRQIIGYTMVDGYSSVVIRSVTGFVLVDRGNPIAIRQMGVFVATADTKPVRLKQLGGYAISKTPPRGKLRGIAGYLVTRIQPTGQVRHIDGYIVLTSSRAVVRDKTGMDALLDLMNANAKVTFTYDTIVIGAVTYDPMGTVQGRNTKVKITAKGQSLGYSGSNYLYYDRIPIERYYTDRTWKLSIAAATTTRALVAQINSLYGGNLVATDIVDTAVPANATGIRLTAADQSYMFVPGSYVALGSDPGPIPGTLDDDIPNSMLNGFDIAT